MGATMMAIGRMARTATARRAVNEARCCCCCQATATAAARRSFFSFAAPAPLEHKASHILPYKPRDVYAVVADIDSYEHFVPYASRSRVLSASTSSSTRQSTSSRRLLSTHELASKPWIPGTGANAASAGGDKWELEAELAVGAMGFDERYKSHVTLVPLHTVTAIASDSPLFQKLSTTWHMTPLFRRSPSSSFSSPKSMSSASTVKDGEEATQTRVELSLSCTFSSPLHAAVSRAIWDKLTSLMVASFEKRLAKVVGTGGGETLGERSQLRSSTTWHR